MPNDPRIKFKKKVYDPSRNLMYEERTGGGGGSFPSGGGGGGGGGGGIPWTPIVPSNPVNPVNPVNPYLPSFPIVPTAPFDPYERKLQERLNERARVSRENAQKYYEKTQRKIVGPKYDILDDDLNIPVDSMLVDDGAGVFGKGQVPVIKPVNLLDPPAKPAGIPRTLPKPSDVVPDGQGSTQAQLAAIADAQKLRDEVLVEATYLQEVEGLGDTSIGKAVARMQADGKPQSYIDSVVNKIKQNQAAKAVRMQTSVLSIEDQLKIMLMDVKDPRLTAGQVKTLNLKIAELKNEIEAKLASKVEAAKYKYDQNKTSSNKALFTKAKNTLEQAQKDFGFKEYERFDPLDFQPKENLEYMKADLAEGIDANGNPLTAEGRRNLIERIKQRESEIAGANVSEDVEMQRLQERLNEIRGGSANPEARSREGSLAERTLEEGLGEVRLPARPREGSLTTQTLEDSLALDRQMAEMTARQEARRSSARPEATEAEAAEGEMVEMGGLTAQNDITTFNEYYDTFINDDLFEAGFKIPDIPENVAAAGDLAIKKYVLDKGIDFMTEPGRPGIEQVAIRKGEKVLTGKKLTKERVLRNIESRYQKAQAQQDALPSSSAREIRPPPGEAPSLPPTPPEFELHGLDSGQSSGGSSSTPSATEIMEGLQRAYGDFTVEDLQPGRIERGGRVPTEEIELEDLAPARGGRVATEDPDVSATPKNPIDEKIAKLREKIDTASVDLAKPNTPAQERYLKTQKTKAENELGRLMKDLGGPSTDVTPTRPVTDRVTRSQTGELQPMELKTVDIAPSARPSVRPTARGRAKIAPTPKAPAPKPTLNFGGGNIQGGQTKLVSSRFTNAAEQFGSSLKGLSSRVPTLKAPSVNTIKRVGVEGGKMGAGIVVGIGVSYLMAQYFKAHPATDTFSQIGQQYAVGFAGAAAGNIVMRALSIAGRLGAKKVFTTAGGLRILAMESAAAMGEAAVFVAVQLGVELGTEALMDRYKFSHTASKTTAAATGGIVGIGAGAKQGGPYGAVLMAAFAAYSITTAYFEGQEADKEEAETRRTTAANTNKVNSARMQLVRNLKLVDNDYDKAYHMLTQRQQDNINLVGAENALNFRNSLMVEFNPLEKERNGNPYASKEPEVNEYEKGFFNFVEGAASFSPAAALLTMKEKSFQEQEAREQAAKDKYYEAYVNWYVNKKSEVISSPPPEEDEGFRLLERDTLGSWRTSAEFSAELVYEQTQNYNRIVNNARNQVLDEWHNNMTTLDELKYRDEAGRNLVETAGLDDSFYTDYEKWVIQDATTQLAVQFNHFGVNYRDADQKLVAVAGRDPTVLPALDHYYEIMTQLSKETGLPVAELARLDALPEKEQERELGKINAIREKVIREGLNKDKATVDAFNAGLIRDMQSYGDNFEEIMNNINHQQMLMGYSYLYGTNRTDLYRQLHIEAPVIKIENPYAGSTEFDYNKNRTPGDTLIYGYRYNLTDSQNQELEEYLYDKNRALYQKGDTKGRLTTEDAMAKAAAIYDRDIGIYRKTDEEVAKDNNMTLDEYYEEYGYDMDKKPPVIPIEWKDITERADPPPQSSNANIESDDRAGERQANAAMQQARIEAGGTADEFDRMATGAYDASQRALVDAQGGNNIEGNQPRTNANGETIRQENDPDGP